MKKIIIFGTIGIAVALGAVFASYLYTKSNVPEGEEVVFREFLPFGKVATKGVINQEVPIVEEKEKKEEEAPKEEKQPRLFNLSKIPTAGAVAFIKERPALTLEPPTNLSISTTTSRAVSAIVAEKETTTTMQIAPKPVMEKALAIRYASRENGSIYETFVDQIKENKIIKSQIPIVYDAMFADNKNIFMRYIKESVTGAKTIETFVGSLPEKIEEEELPSLKGSFLPENITDMSLYKDFSKIFYIIKTPLGSSWYTYSPSDGKKIFIASHPFSEWLSEWASSMLVSLTTKPSGSVGGFMYLFSTKDKTFIKILGNIKGLTTLLSPDGKFVLYNDENLNLNIYDMANKKTSSLGIKTLPEKCVFSKIEKTIIYCAVPKEIPTGLYPDDWYKGKTKFSDNFVIMNTGIKYFQTLFDPFIEASEEMDGIKPFLDEKENYLFFINKKDSKLWGYKISSQ